MTRVVAGKLKVDFFSTLTQARELAAHRAPHLHVRCTVDDKATARKMMTTLVAAPRPKLTILLPVFWTDLAPIVAASKVAKLELVDRSQQLATTYAFEADTLTVTIEVPGGRKQVLGGASAAGVAPAILDAVERCLSSIARPASLTLRTRPALAGANAKRLAAIAAKFGGSVKK